MRKLTIFISALAGLLGSSIPAFASVDRGVTTYTNDTLNVITVIASSAVVLFLIRGGYLYIISTGKPEALDHAKKTIRNALIGLALIISSTVLVTILTNALTPTATTPSTTNIKLTPINTTPNDGVTQVFIDTVTGFMQAIVQSATKPIVDAVFTFLTQTPSVLDNTTIHTFWLVMVGITDALYVLVVALLGLHLMSAPTFGFDEVELKQVLPRIGLSFLGSNISLYLVDYIIKTNNVLVAAVINSTGGLDHAWIVDAITLPNFVSGSVKLVTLLFFILFLIISIVLLLLYVSRLILISLAAVISPFIFLLFAIPKFADFAEIASKAYIVTVFIEFVHVVVIQLASSFLALPDHSDNSILAIVIAIGLFTTLLKIPSLMMQMAFYTSQNKTFRKLGGQFINVIASDKADNRSRMRDTQVKVQGKVVNE